MNQKNDPRSSSSHTVHTGGEKNGMIDDGELNDQNIIFPDRFKTFIPDLAQLQVIAGFFQNALSHSVC